MLNGADEATGFEAEATIGTLSTFESLSLASSSQ
jgi:hypothetical protein